MKNKLIIKEEEKLFFIDIPNPASLLLQQKDSPWINITSFSSKQEAIEYAQKYLGADENGMISVISEG